MHNQPLPINQLMGMLFGDQNNVPVNTIAGAGLAVVAAALAFKFTRNPLLVGLAALVGVWGSYHGSEADLCSDFGFFPGRNIF